PPETHTLSLHDALPIFNAYAGKYKNRGQYDPYANIYAAVRYARSRYGSGWAARMAAPGGYYMGGSMRAGELAIVGERGPEIYQRSEEHTSELQSRENLV